MENNHTDYKAHLYFSRTVHFHVGVRYSRYGWADLSIHVMSAFCSYNNSAVISLLLKLLPCVVKYV